MTPIADQSPSQIGITWWIIWGAMSLSLCLLAVALHVSFAAGPGDAPGAPPELDRNLSIAAAGLVIVAIALRRFLRSDGRLRAAAEQAARLPAERRETAFLVKMQGALIVSLALHEAVALIGFVVAFLHGEPSRYWPFLSAALALNLLVIPRPQALLTRARELCPQLAALALLLATLGACSFRGGDFTPMQKEPETPCLREANEICKEKLKSADIGNCVAREKYRCELQEQEERQKEKPATPESS